MQFIQAVEEAQDEDEKAAAELGMDVPTYTDWAAHIHAGCDIKARQLNMTVDEYKQHAWRVIMEARKRDWTGDPEIREVDTDEDDDAWDPPPGMLCSVVLSVFQFSFLTLFCFCDEVLLHFFTACWDITKHAGAS